MTERYYNELARILSDNGIQTASPERNTLPILLDGLPACRVEPSGILCKFPEDLDTPEANELYHKVTPLAQMVKEYMTAIERAPLLKATALDEDFRLLAEFNGAVLAVLETEYGYKFATWERDYEGTGVCNGEYYLDGYTDAKQDFAIRAGLIEKQRIFSDVQLLEIYRSVNDTFDAGYNLAQTDEKKLTGIQKQIEYLLPDVKEQAATLRRTDAETVQGQSM